MKIKGKEFNVEIVSEQFTHNLSEDFNIKLTFKVDPNISVLQHNTSYDVDTMTIARSAIVVNKDYVEINDYFGVSIPSANHLINKSQIRNIDSDILFNYFDEQTRAKLSMFVHHQIGGTMTSISDSPYDLYFNGYRPEVVVEEEEDKKEEPLSEEDQFFAYEWNQRRMENIKKHFSGILLEMYPSGLSLYTNGSNKEEYTYYKCLLDLIQNAKTFTDVMNIVGNYDVNIYKHRFDSYRPLQHVCSKFNALLLELIIITKYRGKWGYINSGCGFTGKTFSYYRIGYISAYNTTSLNRINNFLGGRQYLYMV